MNASITVNIVPSTPKRAVAAARVMGARRRRSSLMAIAAVTTTTRTSAEIHVRTDEYLSVPSVRGRGSASDGGTDLRT